METREYRTMDKTTWGAGPWQDEPDKRQWQDGRTGLPCLVVRNNRAGNLCGYVGVPSTHPAYGKEYSYWNYDDDGNEAARSPVEGAINDVEVHGGLTFANGCGHSADESQGICHAPGAGEPDDVHWFGFDCAHGGDLSPATNARFPQFSMGDETYKTVGYVAAECARLAWQLAAIAALDDVRQAVEAAIADRA